MRRVDGSERSGGDDSVSPSIVAAVVPLLGFRYPDLESNLFAAATCCSGMPSSARTGAMYGKEYPAPNLFVDDSAPLRNAVVVVLKRRDLLRRRVLLA